MLLRAMHSKSIIKKKYKNIEIKKKNDKKCSEYQSKICITIYMFEDLWVGSKNLMYYINVL